MVVELNLLMLLFYEVSVELHISLVCLAECFICLIAHSSKVDRFFFYVLLFLRGNLHCGKGYCLLGPGLQISAVAHKVRQLKPLAHSITNNFHHYFQMLVIQVAGPPLWYGVHPKLLGIPHLIFS